MPHHKPERLRYTIEDHYGGIILTRNRDRFDMLFQPGDDAEYFQAEYDQCRNNAQRNELCSQYDDYMQPTTRTHRTIMRELGLME